MRLGEAGPAGAHQAGCLSPGVPLDGAPPPGVLLDGAPLADDLPATVPRADVPSPGVPPSGVPRADVPPSGVHQIDAHQASAEPVAVHPSDAEPLQHVAYLHDGSLEGLLCCVFEAYSRREVPEDIVTERDYQPRLEQSSFFIQTDFDRALRVRRGIEREAGSRAFGAVVRAAANDDAQAGMVVFRFIRYVMDKRSGRNRRRNVLDDLANPVVADLVALGKHVRREEERLLQFVRFSHLENGVWFARCCPNANVVPLVMGHFVARFNVQPFIIYDENHRIAGVYDGNGWSLVSDEVVDLPSRTAEDAYIEALWQRFYDSLAIGARYNPELQRHFIPARLAHTLPEMQHLPREALMRMGQIVHSGQ